MAHDPTTHDLRIRPLADGEERALARVMRRSFGGLAALLFSAGKATFVAEEEGRMVGGVTLGAFDIGDGRRGGVVKWVFTLPEARGLGVASLMLDEAMAWFDAQGVTEAFACIEGLNPGSSNRFAERGFAPLGFTEQVRRYGARVPRVGTGCSQPRSPSTRFADSELVGEFDEDAHVQAGLHRRSVCRRRIMAVGEGMP